MPKTKDGGYIINDEIPDYSILLDPDLTKEQLIKLFPVDSFPVEKSKDGSYKMPDDLWRALMRGIH